jgi:DNA-directed RNA polymerase specialized sigma24 family protein
VGSGATTLTASAGGDASPAIVALPPVGEGFEDRFAGLFDLAYRVAFRILGTREDAADVAAETMARAEVRWAALASAPEAWVARVAGNGAIGVWRRRRRAGVVAVLSSVAADTYVPDRVDLVVALRRLPRRQRQVVVLRYLADRPEAEVAAELGCSVGSVKTHANRGLAALRAHLEGT